MVMQVSGKDGALDVIVAAVVTTLSTLSTEKKRGGPPLMNCSLNAFALNVGAFAMLVVMIS